MSHFSSSEFFFVVSYDITNSKRRNRVAKILVNTGTRVQFSVFELVVDKKRLMKTLQKIRKVINLNEDSIRVYRFCPTCREKIEVIGQGKVTENEDFYIF